MKDKILNILTYLVALVIIGNIIIQLITNKFIKGLTPCYISLFIFLYSFDKKCKYNKKILYLLAIIALIIGILEIIFIK